MVSATQLLAKMVELDASDLFVKADNSPYYRVDGVLAPDGTC